MMVPTFILYVHSIKVLIGSLLNKSISISIELSIFFKATSLIRKTNAVKLIGERKKPFRLFF